jgi:hypothetical protein
MKTKYIFLLAAIFMQYGCKNTQKSDNGNHEVISVNLHTADDSPYLQNIEQVEIIPLETTEQCIIGTSRIVRMDTDNILFVDEQSNEIYIFTISGKYMNKISKRGQGPQEYIRVDDVRFHPKTSNIIILDAIQKKVLEYAKDGMFISEKKIPVNASFLRFSYIDDSHLIFERTMLPDKNELQYSLFIFSENLEPITKLFPYSQSVSFSVNPRQSIQHANDQLFYLPLYEQTLYKIDTHTATPFYACSLGKNDLLKKFYLDYQSANPMDIFEDLKKGHSIYFFNINVSDSQLCSDFRYKDIPYFHIYNRDNKGQKLFYDESMANCHSTIIPLTSIGDKFVSLINPGQIEFLYKYNKLNNTLKLLDEQDNPAIIKYKFKID